MWESLAEMATKREADKVVVIDAEEVVAVDVVVLANLVSPPAIEDL